MSVITVLAVDTGLLILMLIGLVRDGYADSGIRHLLYNQVTPTSLMYHLPQILKRYPVHHLDDLGSDRGDTTGGP